MLKYIVLLIALSVPTIEAKSKRDKIAKKIEEEINDQMLQDLGADLLNMDADIEDAVDMAWGEPGQGKARRDKKASERKQLEHEQKIKDEEAMRQERKTKARAQWAKDRVVSEREEAAAEEQRKSIDQQMAEELGSEDSEDLEGQINELQMRMERRKKAKAKRREQMMAHRTNAGYVERRDKLENLLDSWSDGGVKAPRLAMQITAHLDTIKNESEKSEFQRLWYKQLKKVYQWTGDNQIFTLLKALQRSVKDAQLKRDITEYFSSRKIHQLVSEVNQMKDEKSKKYFKERIKTIQKKGGKNKVHLFDELEYEYARTMYLQMEDDMDASLRKRVSKFKDLVQTPQTEELVARCLYLLVNEDSIRKAVTVLEREQDGRAHVVQVNYLEKLDLNDLSKIALKEDIDKTKKLVKDIYRVYNDMPAERHEMLLWLTNNENDSQGLGYEVPGSDDKTWDLAINVKQEIYKMILIEKMERSFSTAEHNTDGFESLSSIFKNEVEPFLKLVKEHLRRERYAKDFQQLLTHGQQRLSQKVQEVRKEEDPIFGHRATMDSEEEDPVRWVEAMKMTSSSQRVHSVLKFIPRVTSTETPQELANLVNVFNDFINVNKEKYIDEGDGEHLGKVMTKFNKLVAEQKMFLNSYDEL